MILHSKVGRDDAAGAEEVRLLHPLRLPAGPTGDSPIRGQHVGVAVDVETTSLDVNEGKIVEIALRRFIYNVDRVITNVQEPFEWREDPGEPLDPKIAALTGLTDADLAGRTIDEEAATRLLTSASFVVAHNSSFDRKWVERRLPGAAGLNWVCSMSQVDWRSRGFDGRVLGYLLLQAGYYHCGHRASADVDALIQMLRTVGPDGRTALSELIETGAKPGWIVRARGAPFDAKDRLKARGYRWDPADGRRVWWREVSDDDLALEQLWLAVNVYADERAQHICPELETITPRTRFI